MSQELYILTYAISEIVSVLEWLKNVFHDQWFPLANNVAHLGQGDVQPGLGRAIIETDINRNVTHAQGASYLGVLLQDLMIFEWNNINKGIQWRLRNPISAWLFNDDGKINMAILNATLCSHRDLFLD